MGAERAASWTSATRINTAQQGQDQGPSCEHAETVETKSGRTKRAVIMKGTTKILPLGAAGKRR